MQIPPQVNTFTIKIKIIIYLLICEYAKSLFRQGSHEVVI